VLDRDGVKKKFDVFPEQVIDYLALVGDSSDNIPGVPRVGAKTAAKWLNQYPTADDIIENAEDIGGKVGESLRENIEQLQLSRELATIRQDVELPANFDDLTPGEADEAALRELYGRFELRQMLRQLDDDNGAAPAAEVDAEVDYETVLEWDAFDKWHAAIKAADLVALDTETTSLDYMEAELVGISLSVEPGKAAYIPLAHDYPGAPEQLPRDEVLGKLRRWLEDPAQKKLGHHLKYDAHIFARYDIALAGMAFDSMLESYVLNSVATRHDMDSTARHYLGRETIHYEDVAGKGAKQLTFNQIDLDTAAPYAAEDADITLQLHEKLWSELGKIASLKKVYSDIEQPLVPVLLAMEETGVLIDKQMLAEQSHELTRRMAELVEQAHELAGGPFNLGSPKQLQQILFEQQELTVIRKTPKGQRPAVDRRGRACRAGPRLRFAPRHHRVPRRKQAQEHLHRQVAATDFRADGARAYILSPGGRGDRTPVLLRPQPAEHPDTHTRGQAHPQSVRGAGRTRIARRRLLADRVAHHGAPVRRRGAAVRVCRRAGHPSRDGRRGVRNGTRHGHRRPETLGQGH
jgi:DNA polymerase-1